MSTLLTLIAVNDDLGKRILKEVSRSFYLTLRLLPREMREAASLGYLLARTSDTIADTEGVPVEERLSLLGAFAESVGVGAALPAWPERMLEAATAGEAAMLARAPGILGWLERTEARQAGLVREVVTIIISGQSLDLTRFSGAGKELPVALMDAEELDDYTWRVAGCVGAFWTKLGFLTLGDRYSSAGEAELLGRGISYGKGLQLVNILRDLPEDLANGRCYLPVADPFDPEALMREYRIWHRQAVEWTGQGIGYASTLRLRRLRAASVLPALIAEETLELLDGKMVHGRVKVPRITVHRLLVEALLF
ncbi:squalene/phytoene synthase family protein [Luteolibacter sp. SL250]|uniref:phytoene/squalene synthase family protein n=1 Tax=Luteolibacter sp. SL250 TaxID=2995170 RepID=UPI00226F5A82|nr:squalene/phytoene synthase family protein [Luteolibacter sp. SL250]WAC21437.1 squalene/phytoene synthase family protein [Luteolibacter sp. SL250]